MLLDILRPTQCGLRHHDQIAEMVEFVRSGGIFTKEELLKSSNPSIVGSDTLIQVRRFEDGAHFLHDGHHRCFSIWLAGRDALDAREFDLLDCSYEQYGEPDFDVGFVTPYDPRKETRFADFYSFKNEVRSIAETSVEEAIEYIRKNRSRYCEPRVCWHIKDLAQTCLSEADE